MTIILNKLKWLILGALTVGVPASASAQIATFTFTTTITTSPVFSPTNVLAVWIEKPGGEFVRTVAQLAISKKQYLLGWNMASAGNLVDAVTGASFTAHGTRTYIWNVRDVNKALVPDGNYIVKMELADNNATSKATLNEAAFQFTVGPTAITTMPANVGGFNNVTIAFDPTANPDLGTPVALDAGTTEGADAGKGPMGSGCSLVPAQPGAGAWPGGGLGLGLALLARGRRRLRGRAA